LLKKSFFKEPVTGKVFKEDLGDMYLAYPNLLHCLEHMALLLLLLTLVYAFLYQPNGPFKKKNIPAKWSK
jgi:hypothetical protein